MYMISISNLAPDVFSGFDKQNTWLKKYTTCPKYTPHGYVVCHYITHDTYQML